MVFLPSKMLFVSKEFSITVTVFLEIKHCSLVEANSPAASGYKGGYKGTEIVECGIQVDWMLSRFFLNTAEVKTVGYPQASQQENSNGARDCELSVQAEQSSFSKVLRGET